MKLQIFTTIINFLLILSINTVNMSNLICDGNVEDYSLHIIIPDYNAWAFLPSNYTCWYNSIGGPYEVKMQADPPITNFIELAHDYPYILCQNLTLIP
jgi:hypothetical protein